VDKFNLCLEIGGNGIYRVRFAPPEVPESFNLLSTEAYAIMTVIGIIFLLCIALCSSHFAEITEKWQLRTVVVCSAPANWVFENYPKAFDMSGIFDVHVQQRSENFPEPGSFSRYKSKSSSETETVTLRDERTMTY